MNKRTNRKSSFLRTALFLFLFLCMTCLLPAGSGSVAHAAAKVTLNVSKKTLCPESTLNLKVRGTTKKIRWKSNKASVASVSSGGKVTAKKTGTAAITAKVGKKTYKCKITVKDHNYKEATCTKAGYCSRCGQTSGRALGHNYVASVIPASKEGRGYTDHVCSRCQDSYRNAYTDFQPDPEQVYKDMIALKSKYPTGMRWTNDNSYYSRPLRTLGYGCAGFALILSDEAFGYLPGRDHHDFSDIRVGDILRVNNDTHSVVIMKITSTGVELAEGNIANSIYWGRTMTFDEIRRTGTYVTTRYPR